jgi:hypothetical protein
VTTPMGVCAAAAAAVTVPAAAAAAAAGPAAARPAAAGPAKRFAGAPHAMSGHSPVRASEARRHAWPSLIN